MRILSRSTRSRMTCLLTERNAAPISFSRPSNWPASCSSSAALSSSVLASRSSLSTIVIATLRSAVEAASTAA